ncbi:NAD(P)/FAD-dependent oxidoreductase [Jiella sonneratiae]|uniref:FAD-binding oxidoreductase n=1 Tax=Jiella sonneratiae TaxID=2816856 RepID=A0ABS3J3J7_9HYPH|nr:FAD-binding oxidoreductase [Jiella sonneratiae]MBO0904249.1 FAD-binding oxidoreductase [Jiella sonneratiae]
MDDLDGIDAIVVGGGVIGLSAGIHLLRLGQKVALIDPLPSPGGASFGNAGLISPASFMPMALPGMLKQVPKWLLDPLGPLRVQPSYFLKALPWLLRWIVAGRRSQVPLHALALHHLHKDAFDGWEKLLGGNRYAGLIRPNGVMHLWDTEEQSEATRIENELRARFGIAVKSVPIDELQDLMPGIDTKVRRATLVDGNGFTVNPARLVETLAQIFVEEGGTLVHERVMKLIPERRADRPDWLVMTNNGNHRAPRVVVAAGAFSGRLLEPLGISLPLETERGYHAMLPDPSIALPYPILQKSRHFGMTPMEGGIRLAGTVEIAGLDAPPNEQRAEVLWRKARTLFPDMKSGKPKIWMGFRPSMPDSLPVIGPVRAHPGLMLCFGHGHYGLTGAPLSGQIVAELAVGRKPAVDATPYAPARFGA